MTFKLFKKTPDGLELTSYDDLENKGFWCALGEKKERAFVDVMKQLRTPYSVQIHPAKKKNKYHPDLLVLRNGVSESMIGEVKTKNSPLFIGDYYGIPPQHALTMDLKDSFNYQKWLSRGVDITVFIWVKWEAHCMETSYQGDTKRYEVRPMKGVWVTKFSKLRELEVESPPPIHWYRDGFRVPSVYPAGLHGDSGWCEELVRFDPRLRGTDGRTTNITSKGYITTDSGDRCPSGQSSGSYVFNLKDNAVFEELVYWLGD